MAIARRALDAAVAAGAGFVVLGVLTWLSSGGLLRSLEVATTDQLESLEIETFTKTEVTPGESIGEISCPERSHPAVRAYVSISRARMPGLAPHLDARSFLARSTRRM